MTSISVSAGGAGEPPVVIGLARPSELPDGLPARLRVHVLIDADAVSRGPAQETGSDRAPDVMVERCLDLVHATALALGSQVHTVCAASTATAKHHFGVVAASGNNTWTFRRGLNGADDVLLESLGELVSARTQETTGSRRRRPSRHTELVVLVALDHAYAAHVRTLRLLGVPSWVLAPGRYVSAELYSAATAYTSLVPLLTA